MLAVRFSQVTNGMPSATSFVVSGTAVFQSTVTCNAAMTFSNQGVATMQSSVVGSCTLSVQDAAQLTFLSSGANTVGSVVNVGSGATLRTAGAGSVTFSNTIQSYGIATVDAASTICLAAFQNFGVWRVDNAASSAQFGSTLTNNVGGLFAVGSANAVTINILSNSGVVVLSKTVGGVTFLSSVGEGQLMSVVYATREKRGADVAAN